MVGTIVSSAVRVHVHYCTVFCAPIVVCIPTLCTQVHGLVCSIISFPIFSLAVDQDVSFGFKDLGSLHLL